MTTIDPIPSSARGLASEFEDTFHRTRDWLTALYRVLLGDGPMDEGDRLAAQRILCEAQEAHSKSEALRLAVWLLPSGTDDENLDLGSELGS